MPGNHDWYDGLTAFLRLFVRHEDRTSAAGAPPSPARTSRCELPHGWWLLAIDAQSGSYLDDPQLAYFRARSRDELGPATG